MKRSVYSASESAAFAGSFSMGVGSKMHLYLNSEPDPTFFTPSQDVSVSSIVSAMLSNRLRGIKNLPGGFTAVTVPPAMPRFCGNEQ